MPKRLTFEEKMLITREVLQKHLVPALNAATEDRFIHYEVQCDEDCNPPSDIQKWGGWMVRLRTHELTHQREED